MRKYEEIVNEGVALLDKKKPTWRKKVKIKTLDMADPNNWILAQLYGSYKDGKDKLNLNNYPCREQPPVEKYGFFVEEKSYESAEQGDRNFVTLKQEWLRRL